MTAERWTRDQAAEFLGVQPNSVQRVMSRAGHKPLGRVDDHGGNGQAYWSVDAVREYAKGRDRRGYWRPTRTT